MALAKEIMGCSMMGYKSSSSSPFLNQNKFLIRPNLVNPSRRRRDNLVHLRKAKKVRNKIKEDFKEAIAKHLDAFTDKIGRNVALELLSTEIDPRTKAPKKSREGVLKDWSKKSNLKAERVNYTAEFEVDSNFGVPGAITVTNKHQNEFFLETITLEGFACGPLHFPCNSWMQAKKDHPEKRIVFYNKPYLPNQTPEGLKALRQKELKNLRGDGSGVRKLSDRIYDYALYNDLGNPDKGIDFTRPTLGGKKIPYPRRCRTGRLPTDTDMQAESRVEKPLPTYVPRDEQFEESKMDTFSFGRLKGVLHNLLPSLMSSFKADKDFRGFADIDSLYSEGILLKLGLQDEILKKLPLPNMVSKFQDYNQGILKYDIPQILSKDKFSWLRDDEFARQAVAGVNPLSIERLEAFPPVSKLDPEVYGPLESALKEEQILPHLFGMTVQQALDANRLYIVDYHDIYLPFLDRINALDGRKSYATRTIFFLTPNGTLNPVAIELSLPYAGQSSRAKRVLTPPVDATTTWLWRLAKAHVCANDAGVHQLVHHWLRTHATLEPFILAAHRQLSAMHPIYKLLDPHMRYTLEINGLARQSLINADGVIEACFTPGRYAMEISAAAYKGWRFDTQSLPADLIRRGMAVPDPTQPHGVKLVLEDYPYGSDGLLIWGAIENYVRTCVHHYYPDSSLIRSDRELQDWYSESINVAMLIFATKHGGLHSQPQMTLSQFLPH
ncbi:hypothetical protein M0R45_032163 [Rubus argutus]|uniref:Lipoxygenase n=1 Tax=Rubus argutus TaxID=59490 RepID=A0AAW1WKA6_RUBAR